MAVDEASLPEFHSMHICKVILWLTGLQLATISIVIRLIVMLPSSATESLIFSKLKYRVITQLVSHCSGTFLYQISLALKLVGCDFINAGYGVHGNTTLPCRYLSSWSGGGYLLLFFLYL